MLQPFSVTYPCLSLPSLHFSILVGISVPLQAHSRVIAHRHLVPLNLIGRKLRLSQSDREATEYETNVMEEE